MKSQPGKSQTSDLERELREAEEAQAEAEAAVQRAAAARAEAESAQRRAREEQEASRRAWAQSVVDAYGTDLAAAETAMRDIDATVAAYMDWTEASLRHYAFQVRVAAVAPLVDLEATPGERLSPPPYSQALDAAIDLHIAALSGRIRDEAADEIRARLGSNLELELGELVVH